MISIVICSKKSTISSFLKNNIESTIGVNYEIIVIDNSNQDYSIFSAYNAGLKQCKYPYVCFVHQDVKFLTCDWGEKMMKHLLDKKTGIIGIAGGKMMIRVPGWWSVDGEYMNIFQHFNDGKTKPIHMKLPEGFTGIRQQAIILDGVFLAMRKEVFEKIRFDELFSGFHGYDFDISIQSIAVGYRNYVVYDILLEHFSAGKKSRLFYHNSIEIYKKLILKFPEKTAH